MYGSLDISASALAAHRTNLDVIAGNVANMYSTRSEEGGAFRRRVAMFASGNPDKGRDAAGVHIREIARDPSPLRKVYSPEHPDAIKSGPEKGYVMLPNVNASTEMVNAMMAARAYEANVSVMEITKSMASAALRLMA